ncbi:MAG: DUF2018 family protein [Epsilonproteobacteria bacterium]|nr:DUF2018 family protein [Campylobacterota bacterium]
MHDLFKDDDGLFMGTPRSKFFDIVFNANRNLVEEELENIIERMCLLEMMIDDDDLERKLQELKYTKQNELEDRKTDAFIHSMGNVLSQNE